MAGKDKISGKKQKVARVIRQFFLQLSNYAIWRLGVKTNCSIAQSLNRCLLNRLIATCFIALISLTATRNPLTYAQVSKSTASTAPISSPKTLGTATEKKFPSLWEIHKTLSQKKFIDLTHAFHPGIPKWKGYPDEKRRTLYHYRKDGFWAEQYTLVGQWGTHADPPAHFHQGLRTLDQIPVNEMLAPLVVIDIVAKVESNPDSVLDMEDIKKWETKYGKIPEGAFVAKRTNWSRRWPDLSAMQNKDEGGVMHYPGWSVDALKFLVVERKILAIGHETTDTDAGFNVSADRYPAQTYIHGENRFQIELLTNLDQVPEYGALIVVTFPKPENSSGFPARVFAILP